MIVPQVRPLVGTQQEKYADLASMPQDMREQVEELRALESEVTSSLEDREDALERAKVARTEYNADLQELNTLLEAAEVKLEDPKLTMEENKVGNLA